MRATFIAMITLPSLASLATTTLSSTSAVATPDPARFFAAESTRAGRPPTRLSDDPGQPARTIPRGSLLDLSV